VTFCTRVRIWIRRSIPLTNGSGSWASDPALLQWPSTKKYFLLITVLFEGTFKHHFSKIQIHKEVKKQYGRNQGFFLLFLLDDGRIRIRISTLTNGSGSWRFKNLLIRSTGIYNYKCGFIVFLRCSLPPGSGGSQRLAQTHCW